jgi:hypothetical protein
MDDTGMLVSFEVFGLHVTYGEPVENKRKTKKKMHSDADRDEPFGQRFK